MEENNVITSILFVAVFMIVLLACMVIVIGALNSGNRQTGTISSGNNVYNETLLNANNNTVYLGVSYINRATCTISSITNVSGSVIDPSNYTVNNCVVTFK